MREFFRIPIDEELLLLGSGEQRHVAQAAVRIFREGGEDDAEVAEEAADGFTAETGAVELEAEEQFGASVGGEGEGKIRLLVEAEFAVCPRAAGRAESGVQLVVFKDDDAVEKRASAADFAARLHARERRVFVRAHGDPLRAEVAEPGDDCEVIGEADADGESVDEKADHVRRAVERGAAAGAGRAEDHVRLAAVAAEQEAPGALDERIEREVVGGGEVAQCVGEGGGNAEVAVALHGLGGAAGQTLDGERGGRGEAAQGFAPVVGGG